MHFFPFKVTDRFLAGDPPPSPGGWGGVRTRFPKLALHGKKVTGAEGARFFFEVILMGIFKVTTPLGEVTDWFSNSGSD